MSEFFAALFGGKERGKDRKRKSERNVGSKDFRDSLIFFAIGQITGAAAL